MAVLTRLPGGREGLGVVAEAVMRDRCRPLRVCRRDSLAPGCSLRVGHRDQRLELGLVAPQGREEQVGVRRDAAPGHLSDCVSFRDQGCGRRKVTSPRVAHSQRDQIGQQLFECASVTGELDLSRYDRARGIFVPQHSCGDPAPPQSIFPGHLFGGEGIHCLSQRRAAASGPSVTSRERPSRSRSTGRRGSPGGGRALAARQTSSRSPAPARCPASDAALHAVR